MAAAAKMAWRHETCNGWLPERIEGGSLGNTVSKAPACGSASYEEISNQPALGVCYPGEKRGGEIRKRPLKAALS